MTIALASVLVAGFTAWLWYRGGGREEYVRDRRKVVAKAADELATSMSIAFAGEHTYRVATPEDFAGLDRTFYATATAELERAGFACIADVVDETMRRAFPNLRNVGRVLLGDGGRTRALVMDTRAVGRLRLFQLIGLVPRRLSFVEVVTEVEGAGRFISTASSLGLDRMALPDAIAIERHPPGTPPTDLVARHRERLTAMQREVFTVMRDAAELFQSVQRSNLVFARHREALGPLTEDELKALTGRPLRDHERELLDALARGHDRAQGTGSSGSTR